MKTELGLGPNNDPLLPEILKFPVPTTVHAMNHGSTDKMINFINQYWWENINKATKSTYFSCPTYPKYNPRKLSTYIFNCPMNHLRFGKWTLFSYPIFMDANVSW